MEFDYDGLVGVGQGPGEAPREMQPTAGAHARRRAAQDGGGRSESPGEPPEDTGDAEPSAAAQLEAAESEDSEDGSGRASGSAAAQGAGPGPGASSTLDSATAGAAAAAGGELPPRQRETREYDPADFQDLKVTEDVRVRPRTRAWATVLGHRTWLLARSHALCVAQPRLRARHPHDADRQVASLTPLGPVQVHRPLSPRHRQPSRAPEALHSRLHTSLGGHRRVHKGQQQVAGLWVGQLMRGSGVHAAAARLASLS
jgi:hypothetical protein